VRCPAWLPFAFAISAVACGGNATTPSSDSGAPGAGNDGWAPGSSIDGSVSPGTVDASLPLDIGDAGSPSMLDSAAPLCPTVYDVYGDLDASDNLGSVNPTLYASGTCSGPIEQYRNIDAGSDAGDGGDPAATDLTVTLTQSAPRSGMFVTVIHQTTPFLFDYTTCLLSAGHGTGSDPGGGDPGTMALVNDPEDVSFPQVQLDTNMDGNDLVFDVSLSDTASFTLNTTHCVFKKN
jgi:hypothetical protein